MGGALTMQPVRQDKKKDIAEDGVGPVGHVITHIFLHARWCDRRLGAAPVALLLSFGSRLGTPWDDRRKCPSAGLGY
ncbi:hypothetical protein ACFCW6_17655 [Streptomyces sp. NPDC056333]|uniref:hypothetical protein n=1 Tax=Streptomyces sp. NPDC056333 TaxID=3345786 RepID=UPI0035D7A243